MTEKKGTEEKIIRVGLFQSCVPHYRLGIFRQLQSREDMRFTICASDDSRKKDFLNTGHKEKDFPFIDIITWRIPLPFIKKFITFQPYAIWSMIARKFDVFIMPNDFSDIGVWVNLFLCRVFGCKVCLWGHGSVRRFAMFSLAFRGMIMRLAHAVLFYTEGIRAEWIKRGFPAEKLFVACNSLDTHKSAEIRSHITEEALRRFREEHGLVSKKIVLYVGRLLAEKRGDVLVRAMKEVVSRVNNAHAIIIGDGPMREHLEQLIAELGLSKSVTLAGSIYDEETIGKYLMCSRVMVMPGWAGLAVQHAFSYGVPVITDNDMRNHPPEVELIEDGVTGFFCQPRDISGFTEAICKVLTDDALLERLSKNACEVIEEKYNIDNMAAGFFDAVNYCGKI